MKQYIVFIFVEFIKRYSPKHYTFYLNVAEKHIGDCNSINQWIKTLDDIELTIWVCNFFTFEHNNDNYYEENSILLTIIIRFFILELDIDHNDILLKNSEIKKITLKCKHILYREYSNRNNIDKYLNEEYSLLK